MSKQNNQLTVNLIQKINVGDINGINKLITQGIGVNAIDNYGNTPLSAVFSNSSMSKDILIKIAKELVKAGADIYRTNKNNDSSLLVTK